MFDIVWDDIADMRFANRQKYWKVSWTHLGMSTHKFRQHLWNNRLQMDFQGTWWHSMAL
jgi:hypothetical protein